MNVNPDRHPGGRPSLYDPDKHPEEGRKLALLGMTNEEMAEFWEIDPATFYRWQENHPEFCEAVRRGKVLADANVSASFYKRALGYEQPSEKVFCTRDGEIVRAETLTHIPADPGAALNWLKNRQPGRWRDKREVGLEDADGNALSVPVLRIFTEAPKPEEPKE